MIITKKVTFVAKDEHIAQLKHLLTDMVDASRKELGCLKYDIFQIEDEPTHFIVIESWEDETSLEGHKNSAHYKHYKAHYEPFTADKFSNNLISL